LHQVAHIGASGRYAGIISTVKHIGHHQSSQNANDGQDHHQLDQSKTTLTRLATHRSRKSAESVHEVHHNLRMSQTKASFRYAAPTLSRWQLSSRVVLVISTALVWAVVAYSLVGWFLRDNPTSSGASTSVAIAQPVSETLDSQAVERALGAQAQVAQAAPTLASRFQLVGVLNGDASAGVALISVDGKPAKPFRVGKPVAEGLVVQSTQAKRVQLGATVDGPSTLSLDLPAKK
jgi:general secretion pathway protein C